MQRYYLPKDDHSKALWLSNFASKLPGYASKYSIIPAEVADIIASELHFIFWFTVQLKFDEFKKKLTAYKNESRDGARPGSDPSLIPAPPALGAIPAAVPPGIFRRATSIANRVKAHKDYTLSDGNDLGIEGAAFSIHHASLKPMLKIKLIVGRPEISYLKLGVTALEVYVKRSEEEPFTFLGTKFETAFVDTHALPLPGQTAIWKYKAVYRMKDEEIGQWSDVISVVVGG